jgi:RNA polymerase sigma-70 factor (ECF subfamily)
MSATVSDSTSGSAQAFATTHWSVVLAAKQGDPFEAAAALQKLCRTYWYPLYAFMRREGRSPHDAQDLTQAFFAHLLQRSFLENVGSQKGKFRSFLLAALKHFEAERLPVGRRIIERARHLGAYLQATQTAEERARSERHSNAQAVLSETAVLDFLYS